MFVRFFTFFLVAFLASSIQANLFKPKPTFLPSEQAFVFSHQLNDKQLELQWQIAEGYYLYKKEIEIKGNNLGEPQFPSSEKYYDEFFGEVDIFRQALNISVPIKSDLGEVEIRYQGCTKGFCYPPESVILKLGVTNPPETTEQAVKSAEKVAITTNAPQDQLADELSANRWSIFWFFVLGVGLAFTPCVLPMLPLLSAIVIGKQERPNTTRAFFLSVIYVQGMALTYTLLGLVVAALGMPFQIALQSPLVLVGLALLFTLLALSMFGLFTLELPHSWQQKLNTLSQKQQGGAFGSVFLMGMIAGLVASPCTSAPLSGALLYVAQSGDLLTGGLALYLLALGMGLPLILITLFGNKILPKSGDWLLKVKTLFGFVMLALPVFLLTRVLPEWEPLMWSALAIALLAWFYEQISSKNWLGSLLKGLVIVGILLSGKPFTDLIWGNTMAENTVHNRFVRIHSLAELQQQLAQHQGKKAMLDFYADWCVACKEFEKYTFNDLKVKNKLEQMLVLQVNMTKNSAENDELMKHFQILGLPTILFFDENGQEYPQRVTGFLGAEAFLAWLEGL